jgi:hypothetical protein
MTRQERYNIIHVLCDASDALVCDRAKGDDCSTTALCDPCSIMRRIDDALYILRAPCPSCGEETYGSPAAAHAVED